LLRFFTHQKHSPMQEDRYGAVDVPSVNHNNGVCSQLCRRLLTDVEDKDSCRSVVQKIGGIISRCCQRLSTTSCQEEHFALSVQEETQALEKLVKEALGDSRCSPFQNYEVLRKSLKETQDRCNHLNQEMLRHTEANKELMQTVGTTKGMNQRLLEQMCAQTSEIAHLSKEHLSDPARFTDLSAKQSAEREAAEQQAQQRLSLSAEAASSTFDQMEQRLKSKLVMMQNKLKTVQKDMEAVQKQHKCAAGAEQQHEFHEFLRSSRQMLISKVTLHLEQQKQKTVHIKSVIVDLSKELENESSLRHQDTALWSRNHAVLSTEKDHFHTCSTRENGLLSSQVQAMKRTLSTERAADSQNALQWESYCEKAAVCRNSYDVSLNSMKRELISLESMHTKIASETRDGEKSVDELRQHIRESDDALTAASSGNEHLRKQMEEHAQRCCSVYGADLHVWQGSYHQRLAQEQERHEANITAVREELRTLEASLADGNSSSERLGSRLKDISNECDNLQQQADTQKLQSLEANAARHKSEGELLHTRKTAGAFKVQLQMEIERIAPQNAALEAEIRAAVELLTESRRILRKRETEVASQILSFEELCRENQTKLSDIRQKLKECSQNMDKQTADIDTSQEQAKLALSCLQRQLEEKQRSFAVEVQGLHEQISGIWTRVGECRQETLRVQNLQGEAFRHVKEEGSIRLASLEKEHAHMKDMCQKEAAQIQSTVEGQQHQLDALEKDLSKMKYLLSESEANLKWMRQEQHGEEWVPKPSRVVLEEELLQVSSKLNASKALEASLVAQVEAAKLQHMETAQHATSGLGDINQKGARHHAEIDMRVKDLQLDFDQKHLGAEKEHQGTLSVIRRRLEDVVRDNEHLKILVGEHRRTPTATGLSTQQREEPVVYRPSQEPEVRRAV